MRRAPFRRTLLILALLGALVLCGTASAHGDPASLYLHTRQVFIPTDVKFPTAKKQRLTEVVAAANDAGFPIRVGLIANSYELGAVLQLWKQPRVYAEFAGEELKVEAKYRDRILIVMPNGFGFHWEGHATKRQYAVLDRIPVQPGTTGLIDAGITGVRKLAADSSVKLHVQAPKTSDRTNRDRLNLIVAAVAAFALLAVGRVVLRRRRRQTT